MGDNLAKFGFESQHYFKKFFIFFAFFAEPPYFTRGSEMIFFLKNYEIYGFFKKNIFQKIYEIHKNWVRLGALRNISLELVGGLLSPNGCKSFTIDEGREPSPVFTTPGYEWAPLVLTTGWRIFNALLTAQGRSPPYAVTGDKAFTALWRDEERPVARARTER